MTPAAVPPGWPAGLRALEQQYRANPSLHATKVAYINGLEQEYKAVMEAGEQLASEVIRRLADPGANMTPLTPFDLEVIVRAARHYQAVKNAK